ncbi:MAG: putative metal-dependent HD superfamily phosphohydrolase [Saprospiraceae bacterium]|jgi:predicted metal-dependent HD superfamily phosphohydrolase
MEAGLDKQRFLEAWNNCCDQPVDKHYLNSVFTELDHHYSEPSRFYHTSRHIIHCLSQYDSSKDSTGQLPNVELAIWMHDVIYEADSRINESRSAQWFREKARGNLSETTIDTVANLVLITQHKVLPFTQEEQCIIDIDLSSFGMQWDDFYSDGLRIRQEFSHLNEDQFITGQTAFMQALLNRPTIYSTQFFHDSLEHRARNNIQGQIALYQAKP